MPRLLDGLYSGILYISHSLNTGQVEAAYFGNLMEWDKSKSLLRVRYFAGPYNELIITREFPTETEEGISGLAFKNAKVEVRNSMTHEHMKPKESHRLKAMVSIPVESKNDCPHGAIAILNVDSAVEGVFPDKWQGSDADARATQLKQLIHRVNKLRSRLLETKALMST